MASVNYAFNILDSVDSTNNYAMARLHEGMAKHGDAYFALQQTGGKGQRGKNWHTGNGENIALSIVIEPNPLPVRKQFQLSAQVALACHEFFSEYAGDDTRVKWPNDIYWRDRKAGGVLIENVIGLDQNKPSGGSGWKYAVVGIGININEVAFDTALARVVSLKQITGRHFDVIVLAKQLHYQVIKSFEDMRSASFDVMLKRYNELLFKGGQLVRLKKDGHVFEARIEGVMENGRLVTTGATTEQFNFGEIEWIFD